jgi:hypothetical protein
MTINYSLWLAKAGNKRATQEKFRAGRRFTLSSSRLKISISVFVPRSNWLGRASHYHYRSVSPIGKEEFRWVRTPTDKRIFLVLAGSPLRDPAAGFSKLRKEKPRGDLERDSGSSKAHRAILFGFADGFSFIFFRKRSLALCSLRSLIMSGTSA